MQKKLLGALAAAACAGSSFAALTPAHALGATSTTTSWTSSSIAWNVDSRVLDASDVGKKVTIKISPDAMEKASLDCNSLKMGLPGSNGTVSAPATIAWTVSGCYGGGANLTTTATGPMIGTPIRMAGTATPASTTTSSLFTGTVVIGSETTTATSTATKSTATPPPTPIAPATTPASTHMVINAKTTVAGGVGAHFQVRVNGTVVSQNTISNTAYQDIALNLPVATKVGDKVEIFFDNDAVVSGVDRNLWVSSVTLGDGTKLTSSQATIDYGSTWAEATDGVNTATGTGIWGAGAMRWLSTTTTAPTTTANNAADRPAALAAGTSLYTDLGDTPARRAMNAATTQSDKALINVLVKTPTAAWYDGVSGNGNDADGTNAQDNLRWSKTYLTNAKNAGKVPQIVLYGIPGRDCGNHSAGGQATADAYKAWVNAVSTQVGQDKAVVIVEPDAISYCGSATVRAEWAPLLTYVGQTFKANNPNAALYLHAGSGQLDQNDAASAVMDAGIANMRGFATNVAGLSSTKNVESWSNQFIKTLEAKGVKNMHYVVDTARSGLDHPRNAGADYNSCNNFNAVAGELPTNKVPNFNEDGYLWIKGAGASDGTKCHFKLNSKGNPVNTSGVAVSDAVWSTAKVAWVHPNGVQLTSTEYSAMKAAAAAADPASGSPYPALAAAVVRNSVTIGTIPVSYTG